MSDEVALWQSRLEQTFNEGGVIGPRLFPILQAEREIHAGVEGCIRGYMVLSDSFQSFWVDTIHSSLRQNFTSPEATAAPYLSSALLDHVTMFRGMRAAEVLLYAGYPLDGLALLRDIKDRVLLLAGIISGLTNFPALIGSAALASSESKPADDLDQRIRKLREKEENRVLRLLLREDSNHPQERKALLKKWEAFFNLALHGSQLTMAAEFGPWIRGERPLELAPRLNELSLPGYFNRASEVQWMILRTMPYLQLTARAFGEAWASRWTVLDESFRFMQLGLEKMGKPTASAVRELIDEALPHSPSSHYVERAPPTSPKAG